MRTYNHPPWRQGWNAYKARVAHRNDNPFAAGTIEHTTWEMGRAAAEADSEAAQDEEDDLL